MHYKKSHQLITFVFCVIVCISSFQGIVVYAGIFPPPGFEIDIHRIDLQQDEPFVELENASLIESPILEEILIKAVYWAQRNMNQTQYWVSGEQLYQILIILNQAYVDKYGMTSQQYAEAYNITRKEAVVYYDNYYFAFVHPEGWSMIIRHIDLDETEPFLEWNNSILESIQALKVALDTAKAWAHHGVDEILYHFDFGEIFDTIRDSLELASQYKYGMSWYNAARAHNSTQYDPVVLYEGDYFSFCWKFPGGPLFPINEFIVFIIAGVVIAGLMVLGLTLINFRKVRSELGNQMNSIT